MIWSKKRRRGLLFLSLALLLLLTEWGLEHSTAFADAVDGLVGMRLRLFLSRLSARAPFSVTELFLLLLPLCSLLLFLRAIRASRTRRGMRRILGFFLALSLVFFFLYVTTLSAGRYRTSPSAALALDTSPPTEEELIACALWLSSLAEEPTAPPDDASLSEALSDAYRRAEKTYGIAANPFACPKTTATPLFLHLGLLGLYAFPFGEVTLARECTGASRVFTLAHELAHAAGYTAEADADLVAFLVCLDSGDPALRYAAAVGMLGRVLHVLSVASPSAWEAVSDTLPDGLRREYDGSDRFAEGAAASLSVDPPAYDESVLLLCGVFRMQGE